MLSDYEIQRVREDLEKIVDCIHAEIASVQARIIGDNEPIDSTRMNRLELALSMERESNQKIQQSEAQSNILDAVLNLCETIAQHECHATL